MAVAISSTAAATAGTRMALAAVTATPLADCVMPKMPSGKSGLERL